MTDEDAIFNKLKIPINVLLSITLIVGLMPLPAYADQLQAQTVTITHPNKDEINRTVTVPVKNQQILVDGNVAYSNNESTQITNANGVSYDAATNTLTLNNLNVKVDKNYEGNYINIDGFGDINVKLIGTNTITAPKNNKNKKVAFFLGSSGNLNVDGGTLKAVNCNGITSDGDINLKSGTYNCSKVSHAGLNADGNIVINKKAKVSITVNSVNEDAIRTNLCTNSYKSIKKVDGEVPCGTEFPAMSYRKTKVNSVWRVSKTNSRDITLVKFHELPNDDYFKAYNILLGTSYYDYNLVGIESDAFNTKEGKKLDMIYLGPSIKTIKKNAFRGTSFKELSFDFKALLKKKNGKIKLASGIDKKFFSNAKKVKEISIEGSKVKKTKKNLELIKKLLKKSGVKSSWWYYGWKYDYGIKG